MSKRSYQIQQVSRRNVLATALAIGLGLTGQVIAQSTVGNIFGTAQPGETVVAKSSSGITRTAAADESGKYSINSLPAGTYTVTLQKNGATVDSRNDVGISVGQGTNVSFTSAGSGASATNAQNLEGLTVSASALPPIDVTSTNSSTVITSKQLQTLPIARSAEAIALLAPGAVQGSGAAALASPTGRSLVSFGGSSVTENAYYINGMNVTDPISGLGGIELPYGSIEQQQVLTGGYGAEYGRSDGGVINQIGKRGTNEWHFGGQVLYTPTFGRSDPHNIHYPRANSRFGQVRTYRNANQGWDAVESAYLGGPLIQDKLFFFASLEGEKSTDKTTDPIGAGSTRDERTFHDPKGYLKIDWNINDSNILELTGAFTKHQFEGDRYTYDYSTHSRGDFLNQDIATKNSAKMWIAKYTGYITDSLTVTAQYGKQITDYYQQLPASYDPNLTYLVTPENQNPALNGGQQITNTQTIYSSDDPRHQARGANYRFDVSYVLGDHTITAGIDNQRTQDLRDTAIVQGNAGYAWEYGDKSDAPNSPISDNVDAPGGYPGGETGYYVDKYLQFAGGSVRVDQRAQYIQDAWQVNDRLLLNLGLRNDQFTNYNSSNQPFINQHKPQWAPRLGFSWDVTGDSSLKIYGNAGRYYLALPTSLALRGASASTYLQTFYTYTGIDPTSGYPTGLTPINTNRGAGQPVSPDGEYGQPPDPALTTSKSLKAQYQDEYILGFDKTLTLMGSPWVYGAKATYRDLKRETDDTCDENLLLDSAAARGIVVNSDDKTTYRGCRFFNPGESADFVVRDVNGVNQTVHLSNDELGFPHAKRTYGSLEAYLSHPFDGTWYGRVSYLYSHSFGNSEGQIRTDLGQADVAATEDWDGAEIMDYANGDLANDRKHQLKFYGGYQITPEWNVSGNLAILSGTPRSCIGLYGPFGTAPVYAGNNYHFCNGVPSRPGDAGRTPWQHIYSANLEYRPAFADHKLGLSVYVYNLFNEQVPTQQEPRNTALYGIPQFYSTPRSVRLGATYDF